MNPYTLKIEVILQFTIQNVPIKLLLHYFRKQLHLNLQYKMFLLNSPISYLTSLYLKFTIQNVPIKWKL